MTVSRLNSPQKLAEPRRPLTTAESRAAHLRALWAQHAALSAQRAEWLAMYGRATCRTLDAEDHYAAAGGPEYVARAIPSLYRDEGRLLGMAYRVGLDLGEVLSDIVALSREMGEDRGLSRGIAYGEGR